MRAGGRGGAPGVVRAWWAPTWCTKSRRPLYLRSLCTKSHAFFRPWPVPSWCTKTRRPYISVPFAPSPPRFFARGRLGVVRAWRGARLGARNPASPCSSVPFAPSPPRFFAHGRRRLGARKPAGPYISVPFAPSPTRFFAHARLGVVPHRPLALVSSS